MKSLPGRVECIATRPRARAGADCVLPLKTPDAPSPTDTAASPRAPLDLFLPSLLCPCRPAARMMPPSLRVTSSRGPRAHLAEGGPPSLFAGLSSPTCGTVHTALHRVSSSGERHYLLTDLCPSGPSVPLIQLRGRSGLVSACVDEQWLSGPWVRSAAQTTREGRSAGAGSKGPGGG